MRQQRGSHSGPMARRGIKEHPTPLVGRPRGFAGGLPLRERAFAAQCRRFMDQWVGASLHCNCQDTGRPLRGETRPSIAVPNGPLRNADQTKGKMRWSRLSSLLRRQLDRVVDPRLTEILFEVADIPVGAGEACPFRVGARPLHGGARAAAAFASGRLVLDAPASLRLPAAVAGIGVRLGFRGRL
jgi:hypothetical protein